MRSLAALVFLGVLGACSGTVQTYPGPTRPDAQVATVIPENAWNRARTSIAPSGAGEVSVRIAGQGLSVTRSRFTVLPGRHDLLVAYRNGDTPWEEYELRTRPVTLSLSAEAGRTYAIRARPRYAGERVDVRIFAVEVGTGRTVAHVDVPQSHILLDDGSL